MESPGQDVLLLNTHPPQHRISLALTLATNRIVLEEEIREISATLGGSGGIIEKRIIFKWII